MAGATRTVRATGRTDSAEAVLREEYNKLVADVEFIRAAVNTANGGAISISASSLTAGLIAFM